MKRDWLWDRKFTDSQLKKIFKNGDSPEYLKIAALLLSRKNSPQEVFREYIRPLDFCSHWHKIKKIMRQDAWNNPRIDYWQIIYNKLIQKYHKEIVSLKKREKSSPKDQLCERIGQQIRDIRKQNGLTQKALAKKIGVSQQMLSRIEKGKENLSLLTLKNVTGSLGAQIYLEIK